MPPFSFGKAAGKGGARKAMPMPSPRAPGIVTAFKRQAAPTIVPKGTPLRPGTRKPGY